MTENWKYNSTLDGLAPVTECRARWRAAAAAVSAHCHASSPCQCDATPAFSAPDHNIHNIQSLNICLKSMYPPAAPCPCLVWPRPLPPGRRCPRSSSARSHAGCRSPWTWTSAWRAWSPAKKHVWYLYFLWWYVLFYLRLGPRNHEGELHVLARSLWSLAHYQEFWPPLFLKSISFHPSFQK